MAKVPHGYRVEVHELPSIRRRWSTPEYIAIGLGAIAFGVLAALILN